MTKTLADRYQIGGLILDTGLRTVERDGKRATLPKLSYRMLLCLLRRAPKVVSIDELMDAVWQGVVVNQETVVQRIRLLREAIGDDGRNPTIIEAVRGHGYRLRPDVVPLLAGSRSSKRLTWLVAGMAVVVVIAISALLALSKGKPSDLPLSVAVLPFVNLSPDPLQEYLAEGLTVELSSLLTRMPELKVVARTSSFSFKNSDARIGEIASTLNVTHVLEGSVRKNGNDVRVTAQLISADEFNIWSRTYDRPFDNLLELQAEIATSIARSIAPTLASRSPRTLETDSEAYAYYLRGRYLDNLKGAENWEKAVQAYKRALEIDPSYAPAWAGLSLTYYYQTTNGILVPDSGVGLTREAAERALELDGSQADALATLSLIKSTYDWDWPGALDAIRQALALESGNSNVLNRAGSLAFSMGRLDDAVEFYRQAIALDPLNMSPQNAVAIAYLSSGRFAEGRAALRALRELNPEYPWAHINLARICLLEGRFDEALEELALSHPREWHDSVVVMAAHSLEQTARAESLARAFHNRYGDDFPLLSAEIHAWRGQDELAFARLYQALHKRDSGLIYIRSNPFLEPLAQDERWAELLDRIGLLDPPDWTVPVPEAAN
jgi:TolB-like protein/DNA-binding winged helix-turn-helix (wHTH) protein/lipoprotein NlpI